MNKNNKFVITINRELGSGGRTVGRKLAELLGVKYYDKAIVQGLTEKYGLTAEEIERLKAQEKPSWWSELQDRCKSLLSANPQPVAGPLQVAAQCQSPAQALYQCDVRNRATHP